MKTRHRQGRRLKDAALTREAVVAAAIVILDESGEPGLTFRALAERLHSGSGAIYWHVSNRKELLDLACDAILNEIDTATAPPAGDELDAIRALALSLFDTLDRHPWIGAHLPRSPALPNKLRLLDRVGVLLRSFGVDSERQFYVATAIFTYVLGVAAQMDRSAQTVAPEQSRDEWLTAQSIRWANLDATKYPFLRTVVSSLVEHEDREQFTTGLDLLLTGIRATEPG